MHVPNEIAIKPYRLLAATAHIPPQSTTRSHDFTKAERIDYWVSQRCLEDSRTILFSWSLRRGHSVVSLAGFGADPARENWFVWV